MRSKASAAAILLAILVVPHIAAADPVFIRIPEPMTLTLGPGYYMNDETFNKLDEEFRRLDEQEKRLKAENDSLKESAKQLDIPWKSLIVGVGVGLVGGWYFTK